MTYSCEIIHRLIAAIFGGYLLSILSAILFSYLLPGLCNSRNLGIFGNISTTNLGWNTYTDCNNDSSNLGIDT
jgi:hypothetical protein